MSSCKTSLPRSLFGALREHLCSSPESRLLFIPLLKDRILKSQYFLWVRGGEDTGEGTETERVVRD